VKAKAVKTRNVAEQSQKKPKKKKVKIRKKVSASVGPIRVSPGARTGFNFRGPVPTSSMIGNTQLVLNTAMDLSQLDIAVATLYSRLLQMGATMKQDDGVPQYNAFAAGLSFLTNRGLLYASNADMSLNRLPQIFEVIFNLMRAKTCYFFNGKISYSADVDASHTLDWTFTTDVGTRYTYTPITSDANDIPLLFGSVTPTQKVIPQFWRHCSQRRDLG